MTMQPNERRASAPTPSRRPVPARPIPPDVRAYLEQPHLAVVATVNEDGSPLQVVTWYAIEGDTVVINSRVGRRWPTNLVRDPRVAILVVTPERYVELTGTVEIDDDNDRSVGVICDLARRYDAGDPEGLARLIDDFHGQRRITFRLRPERILQHFE
jgi:PPOX class probable F420-dependent enzyme